MTYVSELYLEQVILVQQAHIRQLENQLEDTSKDLSSVQVKCGTYACWIESDMALLYSDTTIDC